MTISRQRCVWLIFIGRSLIRARLAERARMTFHMKMLLKYALIFFHFTIKKKLEKLGKLQSHKIRKKMRRAQAEVARMLSSRRHGQQEQQGRLQWRQNWSDATATNQFNLNFPFSSTQPKREGFFFQFLPRLVERKELLPFYAAQNKQKGETNKQTLLA